MASVYTKPLSWKNVIYSFVLILAGWNSVWFFWWFKPSAHPTQAQPAATVYSYIRRPAGAIGVTLSSVPIALPSTIGIPGRGADQRLTALLRPRIMPTEYLEAFPDLVRTAAPAGAVTAEWRSPAPMSRYTPQPVETPAFPPSTGSALRVAAEALGNLARCGYDATDSLARLGEMVTGTWVTAIAYISVGPDRQTHVFLETPTGIPDIDRAIVKALYTGRTQRVGLPYGGRIWIRIGIPKPMIAANKAVPARVDVRIKEQGNGS